MNILILTYLPGDEILKCEQSSAPITFGNAATS